MAPSSAALLRLTRASRAPHSCSFRFLSDATAMSASAAVAAAALLLTTADAPFSPGYSSCEAEARAGSERGVSPSPRCAGGTVRGTKANTKDDTEITNDDTNPPGMVDAGAKGMFYGVIPARQLWRPRAPYPLWDYDWDGREPRYTRTDVSVGRALEDIGGGGGGIVEPPPEDDERYLHRMDVGVTRHIILVRHGQYDETHSDDERRKLTELGRRQAYLTGRRLAEMMRGVDGAIFGPCDFESTIRVSNMTRAKETAEIISRHLTGVSVGIPDPLLNEGIPSQIIPVRTDVDAEEKMDKDHDRIELAFKKYVWRAVQPEYDPNLGGNGQDDDGDGDGDARGVERGERSRHRFEVIVAHGNVIRYFFCRALQLPPEAWLRMSVFNCSLTYLMIKPNGTVSCRLLGDIGHLGHGHTSFSMNHGLAWS